MGMMRVLQKFKHSLKGQLCSANISQPFSDCMSLPPFRTVYEDSGPGRPLSCYMEEPAPYTDSTGAAGGGNCRFVESPSQDQTLQSQRLRAPDVRGHIQTPQNRPHGHQSPSPDLPEGYGESVSLLWHSQSLKSYIFTYSIVPILGAQTAVASRWTEWAVIHNVPGIVIFFKNV